MRSARGALGVPALFVTVGRRNRWSSKRIEWPEGGCWVFSCRSRFGGLIATAGGCWVFSCRSRFGGLAVTAGGRGEVQALMVRSREGKNRSNGDSQGSCVQMRRSSSSTAAAGTRLSSSSNVSSALSRKVSPPGGVWRKCSKWANASPTAHVWELRLNKYFQYLSASLAEESERRKDSQGLSASCAAGSKRRMGWTSALAASWSSSSVRITAFMWPTSAYPRCTPDTEGGMRVCVGRSRSWWRRAEVALPDRVWTPRRSVQEAPPHETCTPTQAHVDVPWSRS